jgi:hypothetical protein
MCLPYIPDPVRRKTAAELVRKLDAMPEKDCLALIQDIRKNYRIPAGPKTMGELLAEARQKSGAEKLKGHDIMALERFDPEVKHMIVFDVLSGNAPVGDKGDKMHPSNQNDTTENALHPQIQGTGHLPKSVVFTSHAGKPNYR